MKIIQLITLLLRNREDAISQSLNRQNTGKQIITLLLLSACLYGFTGLLIGSSHSWEQALASAIKLPMLFFLTSFICFPTLFLFLAFLGAKQQFGQLFSFILLCNTYIGLVLAAFAPVSFFFLIAGYSYALFKFINVLIFSTAGLVGIYLFVQEIKKIVKALDDGTEEKGKQRRGLLFLRLWALMFAFIGLQLSFTLSPFFGLQGSPFIWFTTEKANFFSNLLETIAMLFFHRQT